MIPSPFNTTTNCRPTLQCMNIFAEKDGLHIYTMREDGTCLLGNRNTEVVKNQCDLA